MDSQFVDYYKILGLSDPDVNIKEIKENFRKMALLFHPDKHHSLNDTGEYFTIVYEAYETLIDTTRKDVYDAEWRHHIMNEKRTRQPEKIKKYRWECDNGVFKMYSLLNNELVLSYDWKFVSDFSCKELQEMTARYSLKLPGVFIMKQKLKFICEEWERMKLCLDFK